jgi:hypothetical protein
MSIATVDRLQGRSRIFDVALLETSTILRVFTGSAWRKEKCVTILPVPGTGVYMVGTVPGMVVGTWHGIDLTVITNL